MSGMRRNLVALRPWQWLVLLALLLADAGLAAAFLPAALSARASASPPAPEVRAAVHPASIPSAPAAPAGMASPPTPRPRSPSPIETFRQETRQRSGGEGFSATEAPPAPLDEAYITGIGGQPQSLPLSCEARAAANWAAYFGFTIDELEFLHRLPASDNPDFGFVGDVAGRWGQIPPEPYGVHAGPVAGLLRQYGLNAYARRGLTWYDLRAQIAAGRPVIVWVVGHVGSGAPVAYKASNGLTTTVARYEHTVILIGYTPERVTILDGRRIYTRSVKSFLESWAVLGNMAIVRGLLASK